MNKVKLGSCVRVTRGTSLSGNFYTETGTKIRLTLGNFNYPGRGFKENTSKKDIFYSGEVKEEFILKKGDIITPLTEQVIGLIGETARIPESNKYIQSGDIGLLRPDLDKVDPNFLYYLIPSQYIRNQLNRTSQQTKIRHTSPLKIMECWALLPNLKDQKSIGLLLCSIDEKIRNNNEQIQVLESLAQTIYDYWFVQFDFPNEDGKPYKSSGGQMVWSDTLKRKIPSGWSISNIGNILEKVISTPKLNTKEYLSDGKYPIIDQSTDTYFAGFSNREDAVVKQFPAIVFGDHSCIVKYVNFPFIRGADGTQVMLSKNEAITTEFLYFFVKGINLRTGYARHYKFLKDQLIVIPSKLIATKFEILTRDIFALIYKNREQIVSLEKLRNELLPLLMNGQVSL